MPLTTPPAKGKAQTQRARSGGPPAAANRATGSRVSSVKALIRSASSNRLTAVVDSGLGKRRHAGMAGDGRTQQRNHQGRRRGFAESHAEIQQRMQPKRFGQGAMSSLGGEVSQPGVVERIPPQPGQGRRGGGADETIQQHGNAVLPRGQRGTENG